MYPNTHVHIHMNKHTTDIHTASQVAFFNPPLTTLPTLIGLLALLSGVLCLPQLSCPQPMVSLWWRGVGWGHPLVLSIPGWTALSVVPLPFLLTPGKWTLPPWTLGAHTDGHMI